MDSLNRLTQLAEDGVIDIKTIQGLDTNPEMKADELKKKFDTNVKNLAQAIDDYIVNPINEAGLVTAQEVVDHFGGGDMSTTFYATGVNPENSMFPVDKALYSNKTKMTVFNNALYFGYDPAE